MNLVDSNVLLYAVHEEATHHQASRGWLEPALSAAEPLLLPWLSLLSYLRITTHASIYPLPQSAEDACASVDSWLARPNVLTGDPDSRHLSRVSDLLRVTGVGGNLVNDAHLAALALQYDATVVSYDNDFSRFPGVRWERPTPAG
jgi:toxin-antitoxin system PIN domain toxin